MKKCYFFMASLFCACFCYSQHITLYRAAANGTSFTETYDASRMNKTIAIKYSDTIVKNNNAGTISCSSVPSFIVKEPVTSFDASVQNDLAKGSYVDFKIVAKTGFKMLLDTIRFKVVCANTNVKFKIGYTLNNRSDYNYSDDYIPENQTCGNATTATLKSYVPSINNYSNSNIIDSLSGLEVRLYFFNTPASGVEISIPELSVAGCNMLESQTTDFHGRYLSIGSPIHFENYTTTPTFADEFNSGSTSIPWNPKDWRPRTGGSFGGTCTTANISIHDGALYLNYTSTGTSPNCSYFGAGLISNHNLRYGYYEIRTKLYSASQGLHQSFWCTGYGKTSTSTANDSTCKGQEFHETQCFEYDTDPSGKLKLQPSMWMPAIPTSLQKMYPVRIVNAKPDIDTIVTGIEWLPDSLKIYINNKLSLSYAIDDWAKQHSVAESWMLSALPTPVNYYKIPITSPVPGNPGDARMWVDYFRFYAPKSPLGINFIGNATFGIQYGASIDASYNKYRPSGWINAYTYNIKQTPQSTKFDTTASFLDKSMYFGTTDTISLRQGYTEAGAKKGTAYRTSMRQVLEYIPNGTYQLAAYVRCNNIQRTDSVMLRLKTRLKNGIDTIYSKFINDTTTGASPTNDATWRKVFLNNVVIDTNNAIVELYSNVAASGTTNPAFTNFDSVMFLGDPRPVPTISFSLPDTVLMGSSAYTFTSPTSTSPAALTISTTGQVSSITGNTISFIAVGKDNVVVSQPETDYYKAATDTLILNVLNSYPYRKSAFTLPTVIQAENYDSGYTGFAYKDLTGGNSGGLYRNDSVDIYSNGTGFKIGATSNASSPSDSEFVCYTIRSIDASLTAYQFQFTYSNGSGVRIPFRVYVDGVKAINHQTTDDTAYTSTNYNICSTHVKATDTFNIANGWHILKVVFKNSNSLHIDSIGISKIQQPAALLPTTVIAPINQLVSGDAFRVFPNPVSGNSLVHVTGSVTQKGSILVEIRNSLGAVVHHQTLANQPIGKYNLPIQLPNLSTGLYLLQVKADQQTQSSKLLVQ